METLISPYLHVLAGRLRIKIPAVKGSLQRASEVEQLLLGIDGITDVTANSITGNVLILFESTVISQQDIITTLQKTGYLSNESHPAKQERKNFTNLVMQSAVELAIERLVLALI